MRLIWTLLAACCAGMALAEASAEPAALEQQARELVAQFVGRLKPELRQAMADGGPTHAIEVCASEAPKIADALSQLMARRGYARVRSESQMDDVWREILGEELAASTQVGNQRQGVLEVVVANSAVLQELTFRKRKILKELNRLSGERKIRDLRFRVGPIA